MVFVLLDKVKSFDISKVLIYEKYNQHRRKTASWAVDHILDNYFIF